MSELKRKSRLGQAPVPFYYPEIGDDDYIAESMYFDALFDVPNSPW